MANSLQKSRIVNLKYIIMACVMLHNFCIAKLDLCNLRWRLSVEDLELNNTVIKRRANKGESNKNTRKISDWLWEKP